MGVAVRAKDGSAIEHMDRNRQSPHQTKLAAAAIGAGLSCFVRCRSSSMSQGRRTSNGSTAGSTRVRGIALV